MTGDLIIRNDYSDAQSVILTLESREIAASKTTTGRTRAGASVKIDIGRTGIFRMPDYLLNASEISVATDTEPTDQLIERQGAMIKSLQALQHNSLVAADETDAYRIQQLMSALSNEREKTKALQSVESLVVEDFHSNLKELSDEQLEEIEHRHSLSTTGERNQRISALKTKFDNADTSTKVELFASTRVALSDEQRKAAMNDFGQTLDDPDAKHTGDVYRGADSTTDLRFAKNPNDEPVKFEDLPGKRDESHGYSGAESGAESASDDHDTEDASHKETQSKADYMIENEDANLEDADENRESFDGDEDLVEPGSEEAQEANEDPKEKSNSPEPEERRGRFPHNTGGGTTSGGTIEDRPVKMDDPDAEDSEADDNFRSSVNKLKVSQLADVERENNLSGEGVAKTRKDAIKEAYDNADDEGKASLVKSVDKALEG